MPRSIETLPDAAERAEKIAEAVEINRKGKDRTISIGLRLNNPGEIPHGRKFKGRNPSQEHNDLISFSDAVYGVRALAIVLRETQAPADLFAATKTEILAKCGRDPYSDETIAMGIRLAG